MEGEDGGCRKEGRWMGRGVVMGRRGCGGGERDVDGEEGVWSGRNGCGQEVEEKRRGQGRHDMTSDQPCH